MNELAVSNGSQIAESSMGWTTQQVAIIKQQVAYPEISDSELALFGQVCQKTGLDPFARQIYAIGRNTKQNNAWVKKMTIQTSIDGFRLIADRSGKYAGSETYWCGFDGVWMEVWLSSEPPAAAKTVVWKSGSDKPFTGVAKYSSYVQTDKDGSPTSMWRNMPEVMIGKCSEALALRKAFPAELSGLYTRDEMMQAENQTIDVELHQSLADKVKAITADAKKDGLTVAEIKEICSRNNLPMSPAGFKTQAQVDTLASELQDAIADKQGFEPAGPDEGDAVYAQVGVA